jgi:hypothetical protein
VVAVGVCPGNAGVVVTGVGVTIVCVVGGSGPRKPSGSTTVVVGVVGEDGVGEVGLVGDVVVGVVVVVVVVIVVVTGSLGLRTLVRGTHV